MTFRASLRLFAAAAAVALAACGNDTVGPSTDPPARLDPVSSINQSAAVGSAVSGGIVVKVSDAKGRPVEGQAVALAITAGNGSTTPRVAISDSKGQATATWTLGTILGPNEVTASVNGVTSQIKFQATGTSGPVSTITLSPQNPRLLAGVDSAQITARSLDAYGNVTAPAPTLVPRDPTLISVASNGVVRVLRRGSATYVVATAGEKRDSVLVTVLAPGQSLCTAVSTPIELAVGQVLTDVSGAGVCVHASVPGTEYALVPFYNSGVPSATLTVSVRGQGLASLTVPSAADLLLSAQLSKSRLQTTQSTGGLTPDVGFETRLRKRERDEGNPRFAGARDMWRRRRATRNSAKVESVTGAMATAATVPAIGDLVKLNVNTLNYCDQPDYRTGRVVAITDRAIVVGDTANPAGGFTDAEYRSIGVTFDTLVDPVDRGAFGAPSDLDNNGHVIIFFTRAVNEQTASGALGVVLGYFYNRDLLPKVGATPAANCPASNEAEVMFLLVPDTAGAINGNRRSKSQVVTFANGTVSHEYQHMINAGRRLYVNGVGQNFEERWLDEGLAHIGEDINFWRASGKSTRANLDNSVFNDPKSLAAYATFENNNFQRYGTYLNRPEIQSPIGFDSFDDDLPTRGAIWNFLRFAADHRAGAQENDFWFKLVNSTTTGVANLTAVLGSSPYPLLRDWAISVFLDDNAANVDPRFQQPSWNLRSAMTNGGTSVPFQLVTHLLSDNTTSSTLLAGNGVSFFRFSVPDNQDALLTVTTGGQALPSTVQLAVVRVK
jgi:hypothetical protein